MLIIYFNKQLRLLLTVKDLKFVIENIIAYARRGMVKLSEFELI